MDLCPPGQCGVRSLLTKPEPMAIANGIIYPESTIALAFDAPNEQSECVEIDTAVRVISVGRRCQTHGYRFVWEQFASEPTFQTPERICGSKRQHVRPVHPFFHGSISKCGHWPTHGHLHACIRSAG